MVILLHKLTHSLKFPSMLENHHHKIDPVLASLHDFRSKISNFITQILLKPEPGPNFRSLKWLNKCFELIQITHKAFAKMVVQIDYPMNKWGIKANDEYLNYTLNILDMLNGVSSSISHLNQAKLSISHALTLIKNPNPCAAKHGLKKITPQGKAFHVEAPIGIDEKTYISEKEHVITEGVMVLRRIGLMTLGMALSGLRGDDKPYMEIRQYSRGFEDSSMKGLDYRFCKEILGIQGGLEEVKEVNSAIDGLCEAILNGRRYTEGVNEVKRKLEVMESSIQGIEKQVNSLFDEVLGTRNKLIDNIRLV